MAKNEEFPRSIRFPKRLWKAIDADAKRCKRSAVRQLEALLLTYYRLEDVEIDKDGLLKLHDSGAANSPVTQNAQPQTQPYNDVLPPDPSFNLEATIAFDPEAAGETPAEHPERRPRTGSEKRAS